MTGHHAPDGPLWVPSPERVARAALTRFFRMVREAGIVAEDCDALWRWSVEDPAAFWPMVWQFTGVIGTAGAEPVVGLDRMAPPDPALGPRWFPGARLNYAENLLRHRGPDAALSFSNELGHQRTLSRDELQRAVAQFAAALQASGVGAGDRVAGFLPNLPETVIAMLGAASIGAVWSSCSPDFGTRGVLDRFGQIEPRILVAADGYRYAGKVIDCLPRIREVRREIASIERVIIVPCLDAESSLAGIAGAVSWDDFVAPHRDAAPAYRPLPFDHPLFIMYSSGTTGLPKCMVHGAGGTLLQHLKELILHTDLKPADHIFYFTTCGWMMWNWLVSSLAIGATVVLYDGAPMSPRPDSLWELAAREGVSVFGTSAKFLALTEKAAVEPARDHDLTALRTILSTGSPLAGHSYDYVYGRIKADVHLASISGGTDIISCFALGNPVAPVWRGEIQMRGLGMAVHVFGPDGTALSGEPGELVCARPFPSMPIRFWNDPDGERYRAAYFARFPGVWTHGDWAELTGHEGLIIYGRSDATLNPGGVRIGTAEIYRQVEQLPEVLESVVVAQEWDEDVRIVLFVRLRPEISLDELLRDRIRRRIREHTSPHHVPRRIVAVADIPRTISGKITELAVREVIHGRPVHNIDALANPAALDLYRDLPELRT